MEGNDLAGDLKAFIAENEAELIEFRRDLHAHPEVGYEEHRTTRRMALRLAAAGLRPVVLPKGTGLLVDIGGSERDQGAMQRPVVALRADLDALPMADEKNVPYRSTVPNVCHACGHDVHTTVLLGAGLFLAAQAAQGLLPGRVRLIFQPAEEVPGGALDVLAAGGITSVGRIFALHCDPRIDVGKVGVRTGPITAACDRISVRVTGPGGHTARPHLTADLVYALGKIVTELPAALSRRVDPRSGTLLVWGVVQAGDAANIVPQEGLLRGILRTADRRIWADLVPLVRDLVTALLAPTGVSFDLRHVRGVPPVVNEAVSTELLRDGVSAALGGDAVAATEQSSGGEDFAWYLEHVPGSMGRLGVWAGEGAQRDLHQSTFDLDERALPLGVRVMVHSALAALG